eukprot:CAMPEP_0181523888 /NCGR_PEP_ID=MMETSP1110-20121109/68136_1 /TAXON_ID=174948 /ORGANISM="Symbiodinium sp., Strain CCMP421" /LENGTH=245 /DNA_ID=CAMNT_0023654579 /DNA_START=10 /DNA_END=747 /DNA_ORIENTATION=-
MSAPVCQVPGDDKEEKRLDVHKKTRLCKFFAMGACTRGTACAFAHGLDQLRNQPDFSKTRLCADFVELGSCSEGSKCKFAHGKQELRPGSAAKVGRPSSKMEKARCKEVSEGEASLVAAQAMKTLQLQQSLHEQAALKLLMHFSSMHTTKMEADKDDCQLNASTSFSRQTTWEGMETASAGFSRGTTLSSDTELPTQTFDELAQECDKTAKPRDLEIVVKNTFLEVREQDGEDRVLRRTRSLPLF